jgi:hypothetical protein
MKKRFKILTATIAVMMMAAISNPIVANDIQDKQNDAKKCKVDIPYTTKGEVGFKDWSEFQKMDWEQQLKSMCYMVWKSPQMQKSYFSSAIKGAKKGEMVKLALIFKKGHIVSAKICGVKASKKDLDAGIFVVSVKADVNVEGVFELVESGGKNVTQKLPIKIIE